LAELSAYYLSGWGVVQNYKTAFEYASKAPKIAAAQNNLGMMYYHGYGVRRDKEKAIEWWQKAAVQGCAESKYMLEQMGRVNECVVC